LLNYFVDNAVNFQLSAVCFLGVCQWLPQGCVLERVFAAQLLDDLDIEGVYPLYLQLRQHLEMYPELRLVLQ
jgi:hypothetical protein